MNCIWHYSWLVLMMYEFRGDWFKVLQVACSKGFLFEIVVVNCGTESLIDVL